MAQQLKYNSVNYDPAGSISPLLPSINIFGLNISLDRPATVNPAGTIVILDNNGQPIKTINGSDAEVAMVTMINAQGYLIGNGGPVIAKS